MSRHTNRFVCVWGGSLKKNLFITFPENWVILAQVGRHRGGRQISPCKRERAKTAHGSRLPPPKAIRQLGYRVSVRLSHFYPQTFGAERERDKVIDGFASSQSDKHRKTPVSPTFAGVLNKNDTYKICQFTGEKRTTFIATGRIYSNRLSPDMPDTQSWHQKT